MGKKGERENSVIFLPFPVFICSLLTVCFVLERDCAQELLRCGSTHPEYRRACVDRLLLTSTERYEEKGNVCVISSRASFTLHRRKKIVREGRVKERQDADWRRPAVPFFSVSDCFHPIGNFFLVDTRANQWQRREYVDPFRRSI